jgi:hypothetical protein
MRLSIRNRPGRRAQPWRPRAQDWGRGARVGALVWLALAVAATGAHAAEHGLPATASAVHADAHYAAWVAALDAPLAHGNGTCATSDALDANLVERHRRRAALIEALAARGIVAAPPPAGAGPWPWGPNADPATPVAVVDSNDTAILIDNGTITYRNRVGELEVDPVLAARAFYAAHHDEYDFLVLCTNFPTQLAAGAFLAYHQAIANDVTGLGYALVRTDELFDNTTLYTGKPAAGRLQSFVHLNNVNDFPADPHAQYVRPYSTTTLLAHEMGHRWLARVWLSVPGTGPEPLLLGRQGTHWSFFFNSGSSPLEGNSWAGDTQGFSTLDVLLGYGPLDLYLMGMMGPDDVPPESLWYVDAPQDFQPAADVYGNPWYWGSWPTPGVSCRGTRRDFTVRDVVLTNGIRLPAYPDARRDFRAAFALVTPDAQAVTAEQLAKLAALRDSFQTWFTAHTLGRGHVDFTLARVPARILFVHRPHGDVEDPAQPITIETGIALEQWSLPTSLDDIHAVLTWSVDGGAATVVPMTSTLSGHFEAAIPPQPVGSTLRYSMLATSNFPGHQQHWPVDTPDSSFTFHVASDRRGPTLQHLPRTAWSPFAEPVLLRVVARDEHAVEAVWVEYRVAGNSDPPATLPLVPVGVTDIYEARWSPPGRLGDRVEYRILARDAALTPHTSSAPAVGYISMEIRRPLDDGAESDDLMWQHRSLAFARPDQWHREAVSPLTGWYSWKVGPANNTAPGVIAARQDAVLESPALAVFPGGSLSFRHRFAFLLDAFDPRHYAVDGGLVEWQDIDRDGPLDRWYILDPDAGYTHTIAPDVQSFLPGYPVFSGDQPLPTHVTCTLPSWVVNRTVRIRFRVAIAPVQAGRPGHDGWVLDDIVFDPGPPPTAIALAALEAAQRDTGVRLTWQAADLLAGDAFRIARAVTGASAGAGGTGDFTTVATLAARAGRADYAWDDATPPAAGAVLYRVALWRAGQEVTALVVRLELGWRFALRQNVPNPFNPTTRLRFELATAGPAQLAIYDVRGHCVRMLADAALAAGPHSRVWDGTDAHGAGVASGVYLARLTSGGQRAVRRLLLVR